jgi:hypothetical protein
MALTERPTVPVRTASTQHATISATMSAIRIRDGEP